MIWDDTMPETSFSRSQFRASLGLLGWALLTRCSDNRWRIDVNGTVVDRLPDAGGLEATLYAASQIVRGMVARAAEKL